MTPVPDCMAVAAGWARTLGLTHAARLIERRAEYGRATHGAPLAWPNGRDPIADWAQEALDTCAGYAVGVILQLEQRCAPPGLVRRLRRWCLDGLALLDDLQTWAVSAGCGDLLAQQPPPTGGHEAPDVAWRELSAERARRITAERERDRAVTERAQLMRDLADSDELTNPLRVVFTGTPSAEPGSCQFVEVKNGAGASINAGQWRSRPDGLAELVIRFPDRSAALHKANQIAQELRREVGFADKELDRAGAPTDRAGAVLSLAGRIAALTERAERRDPTEVASLTVALAAAEGERDRLRAELAAARAALGIAQAVADGEARARGGQ